MAGTTVVTGSGRETAAMRPDGAKAVLRRYLDTARQTVLWKLDDLAEFDVRRPVTPTGTNLLGLLKHLALVEYEYFGVVFDRPTSEPLPDTAEPNADMYATADETRDDILGLYRRAIAHADATIEALDLDAPGHVPWWPDDVNPVTLQWIMVHVIAETNRHAGHMDIARETIDGNAGFRRDADNLPEFDDGDWSRYVQRVEAAARAASHSAEPS